MPIDPALTDDFCMAYATGIINFILSDEPQTVFFDATDLRFQTEELFPGTSPTDVTVWIADSWRQIVGTINATVDPSKPDFSVEALKIELVDRLKHSPAAITLCRQVLATTLDA